MQEQIKAWAARFGLSTDQVEAGVGALLGFIRSKVPAQQWQQLQGLLPQAQLWMDKAAALPAGAQGAAAGLVGQAMGLLDKVTGGAKGGISQLITSLQEAGFRPDNAAPFVASVLAQIKASAGPEKFERLLASAPALRDAVAGLGSFVKKP